MKNQFKNRKIIFLFLAFLLFSDAFVSAKENNVKVKEITQALFNSNISEEDKNTLINGGTVIRSLNSTKKLSFTGELEGIKKIQKNAADLKPAYVAEIIKILPVEGNEGLGEETENELLNVYKYVGIPYYSESKKKWYDLYSSVRITEVKNEGTERFIFADMEMLPFGLVKTQITVEKTEDYFVYESKNLNKLRYLDKFDAIYPQMMKSFISIQKYNDCWILYSIGAVNAPSIFFLRKKVETSFINRIYTFCTYFLEDKKTLKRP